MTAPDIPDLTNPPARRKAVPLRALLTRMIWICTLPPLLLATYLAVASVLNAQTATDLEATNIATNLATAIDHNLSARTAALQILAASPLAKNPSLWKDLYEEAQGFRQSFGADVLFADLQMHMLFNTRAPFGTPLPALPRSEGQSAAPAALASGQPSVGDIVLGPIARKPLVAMAVPVRRDGQTAFLLLTTVETSVFQQRLDQVALPPEWCLSLLDGKNAVIAARAPPGLNRGTDLDGAARFVVKSAVSPWSVVLEIPRATYRAPLYGILAGLALILAVTIMVSALGGTVVSRRIGRSVESLSKKPEPGAPLPDIVEIADARHLLDEAEEDSRRSEAALRKTEQSFRAVFEQAAVGIALIAPDGRWLKSNQRLCDIVGYGHDELLTMTFQDITHPDDLQSDLAQVRQVLACEIQSYAMEKRYIRKDGSVLWINLTVALVRKPDATPDYFIAVVEDIQGRKESEAEVRRLNAELDRRVIERTAELTAANQELESFAYAVSHDLRAPLRAMNGFSVALAEDYGDKLDGQAKVYLDQIDIASRKMGELIDGILVLSRSTRGELQHDRIDISALATRLLDELARGDPGRKLAWQVEPGLRATADKRVIEVVLRNLLDNAWKYTGKTAAPEIRVFSGEVAGQRGFCISDNGAGFDMAHAGQLFQPFRRLHRQEEFPGTGIGLATVQRIVHRYGGEVRAEGRPGAGATFCFTLPDSASRETS